MVLRRKRHLFIGLGLTLGLMVGLAPASASAASTLSGESLTGASTSGNSFDCHVATFHVTYSVSGTATGPYPGTFTESGSLTLPFSFTATFTTASGTTTISGGKGPGASGGGVGCIPGVVAPINLTGVPYTATIHTANGNFHDEGTSSVLAIVFAAGSATLNESFTSSLTAPVLIAPTTKDQCKDGGWQNFPQFKNQGDCVSSVVSQSQN